jgi:hypothetical protein
MNCKRTLLAAVSLFMCLSAVAAVSAQQLEGPVPKNPAEAKPCDNPIGVPGKPPADQVSPVIPSDPSGKPPDAPLSPLIIGVCGHGQGHNPDYPCR